MLPEGPNSSSEESKSPAASARSCPLLLQRVSAPPAPHHSADPAPGLQLLCQASLPPCHGGQGGGGGLTGRLAGPRVDVLSAYSHFLLELTCKGKIFASLVVGGL